MFGDVISDVCDNVLSAFSKKKRDELRARPEPNRLRGALSPMTPARGIPAIGVPVRIRDDQLGEYAEIVRRAREDREEILRLLHTIPDAERARIPSVQATAVEIVSKIEIIAADLARLDEQGGARYMDTIDAEITTLESEANPLETARSEARVRRLAQLRRDRRALLDASRKREARRGQLESCRLALENVRLDLVRLRTGNSSVQSVTLVAEQAMALARDVDIAVSAAGEVRDATRGGSSARATAV